MIKKNKIITIQGQNEAEKAENLDINRISSTINEKNEIKQETEEERIELIEKEILYEKIRMKSIEIMFNILTLVPSKIQILINFKKIKITSKTI